MFTPAFTAHRFDLETGFGCLLAFLSFCFCASSVYLLNDLLDLRSDRDHPRKRRRPLASGRIDHLLGVGLIPVLLLLALAIAVLLPRAFLETLAAYYVTTLAYSIWLKRVAVLDVITLACLYGIRLQAGACAVVIVLSPWMVTFALFFFLCLALVKRCVELLGRIRLATGEPAGRDYRLADLPTLQTMAVASGFAAIVTLCLYIHSAAVSDLYRNPANLWAIVPILVYWVCRVLVLANRGEMHDDPVVFAIRDHPSLVCALGVVAVMVASV